MRVPSSIKQSFEVKYSYQLYFTQGLFLSDNPLLNEVLQTQSKERNKILVVVDSNVVKNHPNLMDDIKDYSEKHQSIALKDLLIVEGGENAKVDGIHLQKVLEAINDLGICRHSFVLVIGGGAVIDMVGYAAAVAHRGVKLIRVPSTVLAQNDAAVGVKNGINSFGKKNFLGSFAPPFAIINDFSLLETLEQRDWISGIAEAVKVATIQDAAFFDFLEKNAKKMKDRDMKAMSYMIYRCAELHMQHIAQGGDPFESGSSRPLDFGHWAAHKLEQMTNYKVRHGEAVAMGIALDLTYAELLGFIDKKTLNRVLKVLTETGFDLELPLHSEEQVEELLLGINEFREHLGGQLTITLIKGIGHKYDVNEMDYDLMRRAIALRKGAKALSL